MAGDKRKPERPSSVDRLDPAIQQQIHELRFAHGRTLDEILEHLKSLGVEPPSRTALGRHLKGMSAQLQARMDAELGRMAPVLTFANSFAEAMVSKVDAADADNKFRASRELIQSQIFRALLAETQLDAEESADPEVPRLGPKELFAFARTLQTLAQAERTEEQRIRERVDAAVREQREKVAQAVEKVAAKEKGISAETLREFTRYVLGEA